jgi:hypothetical protein
MTLMLQCDRSEMCPEACRSLERMMPGAREVQVPPQAPPWERRRWRRLVLLLK